MQNQKEIIGIIVSLIIVVCVIGLVVYLLLNQKGKVDPLEKINDGEVTEQTQGNTETKTEKPNTSKNTMENSIRVLSNFTPVSNVAKLEKIDLVVGSESEVKAGDTVSVHYTGAVAATGAVFQSSKDFGTNPVTFPLGNVIKGWTDGIPGMKVGGTRRLVIPASMAYGANPPGGSEIPANADLVFDVELVGIE